MKKVLIFITLAVFAFTIFSAQIFASDDADNIIFDTNISADSDLTLGENIEIDAKSAILMNAETGAVLYAKNVNEALAPASVTKIMTLLLVAEAVDNGSVSLDDEVTISASAASMGGSQVFLEEGERFTVDELIKCAVIASANDAAVALAEHIAGSESLFVEKMNKRAAELGMKSTSFENATGLDDSVTKHLTSSYDIALMSCELMKHTSVMKYASVWQDTIRDGKFTLTNTNRLVRYYSGCTGLKTGSTDKAGFCISATAKRGSMTLVAVIMGAETRDIRNDAARTLLDYGFASFDIYTDPAAPLESAPVRHGRCGSVTLYSEGFGLLVEKGDISRIEKRYEIPEFVDAPVRDGDKLGQIVYSLDGEEIGRCGIVVRENVERITFWELFLRLLESIFVERKY